MSDSLSNQRSYLKQKLLLIWNPQQSEHNSHISAAIEGVDLTLEHDVIERWIDAILDGEATVREPPSEILADIPKYQPTRNSRIPNPLVCSSRTDTAQETLLTVTSRSSFAAGPGYYTGKALWWLGSISLSTIESCAWVLRLNRYRSLLKEWNSCLHEEREFESLWLLSSELCIAKQASSRGSVLGESLGIYRMFLTQNSSQFSGFSDASFDDLLSLLVLHIASSVIRKKIKPYNDEILADLTLQIRVVCYSIWTLWLESCKFLPPPDAADELRDLFRYTGSIPSIPPIIIAIHAISNQLLVKGYDPLTNATDAKLFMLLRSCVGRYKLPGITVSLLKRIVYNRADVYASGQSTFAEPILFAPYQVAVLCLCEEFDSSYFEEAFFGPVGFRSLFEGLEIMISWAETWKKPIPWLRLLQSLEALGDTYVQMPKGWAEKLSMTLDIRLLKCLVQIFRISMPRSVKHDIHYAMLRAFSAVLRQNPGVFTSLLEHEHEGSLYFVERLRGTIRSTFKHERKDQLQALANQLLASCRNFGEVGEVYTILSTIGSLTKIKTETLGSGRK